MKHLHIALFVVISVVLASVLSDGAARTEQGDTTSSAVSLKGQLLVAAPSLRDPNFSETVIFMIDHDQDGAFGLIINRRIGVGPLDKFLQGFGIESSARLGDVAIHAGGPVERHMAFVLHSADYAGESARQVSSYFTLSTGIDVLKAIADGKGPKQRLFIIGYAGWGPGQLESEMARNDWLTAPADPKLVFDDDVEAKWRRAKHEAGISL